MDCVFGLGKLTSARISDLRSESSLIVEASIIGTSGKDPKCENQKPGQGRPISRNAHKGFNNAFVIFEPGQ